MSKSAGTIVYLNGVFLPRERACISVMDRGFLFGDGIYEVIPAYGGCLFRLEQHLERLDRSLADIYMQNPLSHPEWQWVLTELLSHTGEGDHSVYLQVTRGVAEKRDHAFGRALKPTVFAMTSPLEPPPSTLIERGVAAITLADTRWQHCHIKAIALLPNALLRQQAVHAGAMEAILIRDGYANEGAASNLFVVHNGMLITPPKGPQLLPGITRDLLIELSAYHGIPYRETPISEDELHHSEEIWLTSSTRELLPVTQLDNHPVGSGRPGPMWQRMHTLYQEYKQKVREQISA